ncbi:GTPase-associated protein 1-related protein [Umezawaea endophytica]|uniref:GTPase-associated protein 1-related protein n=1 Tax=Umezawaea endophytica TaxID=1654476 RepID=A0A9X2VJ01_9PSEU|nr:GTPase-associated protein 1-related protein [Umezawaea endophytica]MCS7477590.1 GTPase-associated protein 1-related protein [Umezawaea endophytica]
MAFSQLYYTSCERGLSGHPGYQFHAATTGVPPDVMSDVEFLTGYAAPPSLSSNADAAEIARSPVNLCYRPGPSSVLANVAFLGNDYSRRFGNYFAHALVTDDLARDLGDVLPIELWGAGLWNRRQVADPVLPPLSAPSPGPLDQAAAAAFVKAHKGGRHLAALLTAIDSTVADHERTVVIVERDAEAVAHWIAAASYLLPPGVVSRMSFATYQHTPRYSKLHVVGTLAESSVDRSAFDAYHLFDMVADERSPIAAHPLAEHLVYVGVEDAAELWKQAGELATGRERDLSDWYPVVFAAGGADRAETVAVVPWLVEHARRLGAAAVERIGNQIDVGDCGPAALSDLATAARDVGAHDLADHVELAWVMASLDSGLTGPDIALRSPAARSRAEGAVVERLRHAPAAVVVDLLAWAAKYDIAVPGPVLHQVGTTAVGPAVLVNPDDERFGHLLRTWSGLRTGVVDHLAGAAHDRLHDVVGVVDSGLADVLDLRGRSALATAVVIADARAGRLQRTAALSRLACEQDVDDHLLRALWPDGGWTHSEASILLRDLLPRQFCSGALLVWVNTALQAPITDGEIYDRLSADVREHPVVDSLPSTTRALVESRFRTVNQVETALRERDPDTFDSRVREVVRSYRSSGPERRRTILDLVMARVGALPVDRLAHLVVLFGDVRAAYLRGAEPGLRPATADPRTAADLLVLVWELRRCRDRYPGARKVQEEFELFVLRAVKKWRRRPLGETATILRGQRVRGVADWFEDWARDATGNSVTRFFRGRRTSREAKP